MSSEPVPKGGLVLVTGVNSFIGSHVADEILKKGYRVRGTARSQKKADDMLEYYEKAYGKGKIEIVVVEDMTVLESFDEVAKGVDGVAHCAADLSFGTDAEKIVGITVDGTVNALKAAAKIPSIKRFVLTSSSISVTYPHPDTEKKVDITSWNDESAEKAFSLPESHPEKAMHIYGASKYLSEKAAWKFVKENKPGFTLNTVQPNFSIGKILHPSQGGSTSGYVVRAFNGDSDAIDWLQNFPPQRMVNVNQIGQLHVAGLIEPDVQNERLLGFAEPFSYGQLRELFKKIDPKLDLPEQINPGRDIMDFDTSRSQEILRRYGHDGWVDFESSVRDAVLAH